MIDTTEIFLAINSIRKNEKKKPSKSNIYQHLQKDEKHKELGYETFDQLIENLLPSRTIFISLTQTLSISGMTLLLSKVLTILLFCNRI